MKTALVILLLVINGLTSFGCNNGSKNPVNVENDIDVPKGYRLVWNDEFNGNTLNPEKWEYEVNGNGGGNQELQYYTARDTNSFIQSGHLVIRVLKEQYTGPDGTREYTSARIRTKNRGDWTYGRFEIRAQLPGGRGTWPAIWMLPTEWTYGNGGWPDNGEIDIMEHVGYNPGVIHGTVHTDVYNHTLGTQKGAAIAVTDAMAAFHTYAIDWDEDEIRFYVDETLYFTFENEGTGWAAWPFDKSFHLILNIAIGGTWGGAQGVDDSIFPQQMEVDYVRVYERL